jgi:hypothetical protein
MSEVPVSLLLLLINRLSWLFVRGSSMGLEEESESLSSENAALAMLVRNRDGPKFSSRKGEVGCSRSLLLLSSTCGSSSAKRTILPGLLIRPNPARFVELASIL